MVHTIFLIGYIRLIHKKNSSNMLIKPVCRQITLIVLNTIFPIDYIIPCELAKVDTQE